LRARKDLRFCSDFNVAFVYIHKDHGLYVRLIFLHSQLCRPRNVLRVIHLFGHRILAAPLDRES
jgi:hypothetical protein